MIINPISPLEGIMKKVLVAIFVLSLSVSVAYADGLTIDVSGSYAEMQSSGVMRTRNVTAPGIPGQYWIDFQWNPESLMFVPIAAGEDILPPSSKISGTYILKDFYVLYSNGTVYTNSDFEASGTMEIGSSGMYQAVSVGGNQVAFQGTYQPRYTYQKRDGLFAISDYSGTHGVLFWINGDDLNTFSGVVPLGNGITSQEWDYWMKVGESVSRVSSSHSIPLMENTFLGAGIGKLLNK
jgi:hypothetical protein